MTRHLSQQQLLRYLDGEVSKIAARSTARHLQACWSCQVELDRLKEHIASIIDAQTAVFGPSLPPPPNPWPRLEPRLDQALRRGRVPFWEKLLPSLRAALRVQLAYGAAALTAVVIGLSLWVSVAPTSAQEVFRRATAADAGRLAITPRQVVRQKVRVKRTTHLTSSEHATSLVSWKSVRSTYWKSAGDAVSAGLLERYSANGLASALPLSPQAVETWVNIAGVKPSASRNRGSFDLLFVSDAQGRARGLEMLSLHVQARNWHLDEMTLFFADDTYKISEEESTVIARNEVPNDVMALLEPPETISTQPAPNVAHALAAPDNAVNLDDLEMEVRYSLHRIGADLGEGVEIATHPPDRLVVDASQVSPQTKEKMLSLLANKPGVQLVFQTPGAANTPSQAGTKTIPQATASSAPSDQRLMAFFGSAEAEENYTRAALEASNSVLVRLYALESLSGRWPPDLESHLSPGAKTRLQSMVRSHAHELLAATSGLEQLLAPLMKSLGHPLEGTALAEAGATWQQASASGLDAARSVDRLLRSLLTTSDTPLSPDDALPRLQTSLHDLAQAVRKLPAAAE